MPVAGGKLQSDEIFQEIKRTIDAVSHPLTFYRIVVYYIAIHVLGG